MALLAIGAGLVTLVQFTLAARLVTPWIVPDELIYAELAKSLGTGSLPAVRGEFNAGYGLVYPAVLAPLWAMMDDPYRAYNGAKIINAFMMSLAIFPSFFLARCFLSKRSALVIATLSVMVPSMLYSGTLLIEVALYPIFLLALYAIVRAVQHPTGRGQCLTVVAIVVACLTKPIAIVLVGTYFGAVLLLACHDTLCARSGRTRLAQHRVGLGLICGLGVAALVGSAALGNPRAVLGIYGVVIDNIDVVGMVVWSGRHAAELALYVGIVPFVATVLVTITGFRRNADPRSTEFAAIAVPMIAGMCAVAGAYSSKPIAGAVGYFPTEARIHERNVFVVVPLLLIGFALFFQHVRPLPRHLWVAVLLGTVLLISLLPLSALLENSHFQALALTLWSLGDLESIWPLTLFPLVACAVVAFVLPRRLAFAATCFAIAALFVAMTSSAHREMVVVPQWARLTAVGAEPRWIDRSVPDGVAVTALWVPSSSETVSTHRQWIIWMSEFFNRSVGTVVEVGTPMPYRLPSVGASVEDGVLQTRSGEPLMAAVVLVPCEFVLPGATLLATNSQIGARLYRVQDGQSVRILEWQPFNPGCQDVAGET